MKARLFRAYGVRRRPGAQSWTEESTPCVRALPSLSARKIRAFIGVVTFLLVFVAPAHAAIPAAANKHKADLIRAARYEFGLSAPVALFAAQIHVESRWNERAVSPAGAEGLAQFMPATARWLPTVAPHLNRLEAGASAPLSDKAAPGEFTSPGMDAATEAVKVEPLPFNPGWALRAMCAYDSYLLQRITNAPRMYDRWAFALSGYNGGLGWVNRDRKLALASGYDPARYWDHTEKVNAGRRASAFRENREYPRRIFDVQYTYEAAGWGPGVEYDS